VGAIPMEAHWMCASFEYLVTNLMHTLIPSDSPKKISLSGMG
jgi:hypothetical protein